MPFTPYHFGPASWIGLLFNRYLDFLTFLIASVIIDIEPFLVIVFQLNYPLHGYLHTFLGATFTAFLLAILMNRLKPWLDNLMVIFHLKQPTNFSKIVIASICGCYSHILLDAPLYPDIHPFYPIKTNPIYSLVSSSTIYTFCAVSFLVGLILLLIKIYAIKKENI